MLDLKRKRKSRFRDEANGIVFNTSLWVPFSVDHFHSLRCGNSIMSVRYWGWHLRRRAIIIMAGKKDEELTFTFFRTCRQRHGLDVFVNYSMHGSPIILYRPITIDAHISFQCLQHVGPEAPCTMWASWWTTTMRSWMITDITSSQSRIRMLLSKVILNAGIVK